MTTRLQKAFAEAAKLPQEEQDVLASRLLAELDAEDDFDRAIAGTAEKLAPLAREALEESRVVSQFGSSSCFLRAFASLWFLRKRTTKARRREGNTKKSQAETLPNTGPGGRSGFASL